MHHLEFSPVNHNYPTDGVNCTKRKKKITEHHMQNVRFKWTRYFELDIKCRRFYTIAGKHGKSILTVSIQTERVTSCGTGQKSTVEYEGNRSQERLIDI